MLEKEPRRVTAE